jgi:dTMP kinase
MLYNTPGLFVTFEGVDGCGKSTQWQAAAHLLTQHFPEREILTTRNPGGTALGQSIRQLLLTPTSPKDHDIAPMAELLLYMADRAQHVSEVVQPALERGAIILCDRFVDSSVAYQGAARGISSQTVLELNALACGSLSPHLTFLYDADVAILQERVHRRGQKDRLELEGLEFQERVRQGFMALANSDPQRITIMDATLPISTLTQQTVDTIKAFIDR